MFVKTTARKTKSGTVRYLHLAHNEWDPVAGRSVPKILYRFGREDQLDRDAIKRLVGRCPGCSTRPQRCGPPRGSELSVHLLAPVRAAPTSSTGCGAGWASTP